LGHSPTSDKIEGAVSVNGWDNLQTDYRDGGGASAGGIVIKSLTPQSQLLRAAGICTSSLFPVWILFDDIPSLS